jgi:hypothetical protein
MGTCVTDSKYDEMWYKFIMPRVGKKIGWSEDETNDFVEKNLQLQNTNKGNLWETACRVFGNLIEDAKGIGKDFTDQSDAKAVNLIFDRVYRVRINCKNKIGDIRAMIYDHLGNKFYCMRIPNELHRQTNISVEFASDGSGPLAAKWRDCFCTFEEVFQK